MRQSCGVPVNQRRGMSYLLQVSAIAVLCKLRRIGVHISAAYWTVLDYPDGGLAKGDTELCQKGFTM